MAVLPRDWPADRLVELARRQASANRLDTCLALDPATAIYITADGVERLETCVPTGLPVVERLRLAARLPRTPEMRDRHARLRAFALAQTGPGYLVGDGLEDGRPATRDDLVRLVGLDGGHPNPGLRRCVTCHELAGDFLATKGEGNGDPTPRVVRVHCRCENHNRCARCGEPLAERRLSAYHYREALGSVRYVAAYCAFSHRCARTGRKGPAGR